jgi:hypothetical protein
MRGSAASAAFIDVQMKEDLQMVAQLEFLRGVPRRIHRTLPSIDNGLPVRATFEQQGNTQEWG